MTTAKIIPLPLKMKERRAAIEQALLEASWIKTVQFLEEKADEAFNAAEYELGCNLVDVVKMVKEAKLENKNG